MRNPFARSVPPTIEYRSADTTSTGGRDDCDHEWMAPVVDATYNPKTYPDDAIYAIAYVHDCLDCGRRFRQVTWRLR